jgi:hypothetical protein
MFWRPVWHFVKFEELEEFGLEVGAGTLQKTVRLKIKGVIVEILERI